MAKDRRNRKIPRSNNQINSAQVRLIDQNGEMVGIVEIQDALAKARELSLDLVEMNANATPVVCKIMDFGKFKYDSKKKSQQAKKKQKTASVKEIKVRPNIGTHDLYVKLKQIRKFISAGEKVKITLRFKGREISHDELGRDLVKKIIEDVSDIASTELEPKLEGRQIIAILVTK